MKYIVVSHGNYAVECINSCHMITGDLGLFTAISFVESMSKEDLILKIEEAVTKLENQEITILVDIMGGTPFNCAMEIQAKHLSITVITGVSLLQCILVSTQEDLGQVVTENKEFIKVYKELKEVVFENSNQAVDKNVVASQGFDVSKHIDEFKNNSMIEKGIKHIRVDERLIHGQVATMWTNYVKASRILIIDDATCKDEVTKVALRTAAPNGVKLSILTLKGALKRINAGQYKDENVLMLVKRPSTLYQLSENGLNIDSFNIGNCSKHENTITLKKTVYLYQEEIDQINELLNKNVKITAQMVPSDEELSVTEFMKERGK